MRLKCPKISFSLTTNSISLQSGTPLNSVTIKSIDKYWQISSCELLSVGVPFNNGPRKSYWLFSFFSPVFVREQWFRIANVVKTNFFLIAHKHRWFQKKTLTFARHCKRVHVKTLYKVTKWQQEPKKKHAKQI